MDTKLSWYSNDESWISERDDDWLRRFYLLLHTATKSADQEDKLKFWRVLRTTDGHRAAGWWNDIYLPADGHAAAQSFTTISPEIMANLQTEMRQRLIDFFKLAGVRELGEREELQVILDSYYSDQADSGLKEKQHLAHIKRFIRWFEEHKDLSLFEDKWIFWDSRKSGKHQARHCYLDKPFMGSNQIGRAH